MEMGQTDSFCSKRSVSKINRENLKFNITSIPFSTQGKQLHLSWLQKKKFWGFIFFPPTRHQPSPVLKTGNIIWMLSKCPSFRSFPSMCTTSCRLLLHRLTPGNTRDNLTFNKEKKKKMTKKETERTSCVLLQPSWEPFGQDSSTLASWHLQRGSIAQVESTVFLSAWFPEKRKQRNNV